MEMSDHWSTWLRATFEEREVMKSNCNLCDEITAAINASVKPGPTISQVEGLESFLDGLESHQLSTTKDKAKIKSDFDLMIQKACVEVAGTESNEIGGGFFSKIMKFIKNLWRIITEFFSNRMKTTDRAVQRMKVNVKSSTIHPLKGYPHAAEGLLIDGTKPNFKSISWVTESVEKQRKFMQNVYQAFPVVTKHLSKPLTADDFKATEGQQLSPMDIRIKNMVVETGNTLSKGFTTTTSRSGNKGVSLPNTLVVTSYSDIEKTVKENKRDISFSSEVSRNVSLVTEMVSNKFVMVSNHDLETLVKAVDNLNDDLKKQYKTPTAMCRQMEKLAEKTFKDSNTSGNNKKEAAKFFNTALGIAKSLTSGQFYGTVRVIEASLAVINKCIANKDSK